MDFRKRIAVMRQYMETQGLRAIIVNKPVSQRYMSGFETVTYSRPIITVIGEDRSSLILPAIEEAWGREISVADDFYPYFEHPLEAHRGISYLSHLEPMLRKFPPRSKIGVEMDGISCAFGDTLRGWGFELADVSPRITAMRAVKDADEIEMIERAAELVCAAVRETAAASRAGASEIEIENAGSEAAKALAKRKYPGSVVNTGLAMSIAGVERTVMPHIMTGAYKLREGDVVLNTRQLALDGYFADCQRTFFVGGKRTAKQQEVYDIVLEAQRAAIEAVRPGARAKDVESAGRKVIDDAGYGAYFTHRLGKGCGLEALEEPFIRFDSETELRPNMICNILPSIYAPGIGGARVSDTVVVTESGCRIITESCSKNLDELCR